MLRKGQSPIYLGRNCAAQLGVMESHLFHTVADTAYWGAVLFWMYQNLLASPIHLCHEYALMHRRPG